ncbi:zinc-dependent acohol dehydrogenase (reticulon-4-interacting protein 1) [Colletotrichum truncatum]|uniref:Zinc-dependent acohol dehydrogenase (Reticulon-4-interacting protein 1) n=1 Tax=Colletotrichum truncatum TaxID=5467 RepID=A0ACC3YGZ2_COLTU|nr:zinc-dependent acohol dehydrogenase (reticulon-4-interacting protein 1) [Colletotrichum truncatum]KAF6784101.1 zinc-dependent acohol dehydrogenase (reticulon-4-interacting protein 1) [Colletotrichum truncatum]
MQAWLYDSVAGGLEARMRLVADAPLPPALGPEDILVKVHAMSPNPADYKFPEGLGLLWRLAVSLPATPGTDFSGTITGLGDAIRDAGEFTVGQPVYGWASPARRHGSLGEYVVATRDGCAPVPSPAGALTLDSAACLGVAAQTAYQAINPHVAPGDWVFINGGSGGVGTFAIQIARTLGCRVVASCSGRNAELCRSLGADEVLDYTEVDVSEALKAKGPKFKLALDNVGREPPDLYKAADEYLLPAGRFVQVGAGLTLRDMMSTAGRALRPSRLGGGSRKWQFMGMQTKHADLVTLGRWAADGDIRAVVSETYKFEDAPKAYEKLRTGRTTGCLVVKGPDAK